MDFPIKNGGSFHGKMLVHQAGYFKVTMLQEEHSESSPDRKNGSSMAGGDAQNMMMLEAVPRSEHV